MIMPNDSRALAQREQEVHPIQKFQRQLENRISDLKMALPAGISPEKFQRTILTAAAQSNDLLSADRDSLILACYKAAQDGLLPDGREAALVIFNQRRKGDRGWETIKLVQYMPMVYGLRKKILQARDAKGEPIVSSLQVGVVYKVEAENGYFRWERGTDPEIQHAPMLDISAEEAADANIIAAYSIATMADGTRSCEVMRRFEIDQVRQMSQTGATGRTVQFGADKGKPIDPKGPWVDWFAEMAKKTVMRRHAKTLPMSGDVIADLGGFDDELAASRSASAILGSQPGGRPEALEDHSDLPAHDRETGEIIEAEANAGASAGDDQPEQKESKPRGRKPKADQGQAEEKKEPEKAKADEAPAKEAEDGDEASDGERNELGLSKHPAEPKAEQIIADMANASTIIDLDRIFGAAEADIMAMPEEIRSVVDASYSRHSRRLAPNKASAEAETAGAK
jgi:recombination protein RecT